MQLVIKTVNITKAFSFSETVLLLSAERSPALAMEAASFCGTQWNKR